MAIGPHRLEYEVLEGWEQLPEGWSFVEVAVSSPWCRGAGSGSRRWPTVRSCSSIAARATGR